MRGYGYSYSSIHFDTQQYHCIFSTITIVGIFQSACKLHNTWSFIVFNVTLLMLITSSTCL